MRRYKNPQIGRQLPVSLSVWESARSGIKKNGERAYLMVGGRVDKLGFSRLWSDDVASLVESVKGYPSFHRSLRWNLRNFRAILYTENS